MTAPHADPTPEQLQLAFRHLWRPGWPATLDEALRQPLRAPIIRCQARDLRRAAWSAHAGNRPLRAGGWVPPAPPPPAANDRDD